MQRHWILGLTALGVASALPTAAAAQAPKALLDCTAILSDAERLACYDKTVKAFSSEARIVAERREAQAGKLAAAAAVAAAAQKADTFGRASESRIESVDSTLREMLTDNTGKSVFILENGQIWRQADGFRVPNVRPGTAITIRRGAMGSFRITVAGSNRTAQVVRMR